MLGIMWSPEHRLRVGILGSGEGTTADAYAEYLRRELQDHEIAFVVSNNPGAGILDKAQGWNSRWRWDTETAVINRLTHPGGPSDRGQTYEEAEAITKLADKHKVDLVLTLGYMVIINDPLLEIYGYVPEKHQTIYQARAINTHPGPLPLTQDTMGEKAAKTVLDAYRRGEIEESEHSMHVISAIVDDPQCVFARHFVEILPDDTPAALNQRTQWIEKATVPYAVEQFARDQQDYLDRNS